MRPSGLSRAQHVRARSISHSVITNTIPQSNFLVGISPAGFLTYVSPGYGGRISDPDLVKACGYLDVLEPGDYIMADKGFLIRAMLNKQHCDLIIPPKKRNNQTMDHTDCMNTRKVANLRIHVERMMRVIKTSRILGRELPITMIDMATQIFTVCAYLTQQWGPLVGYDFFSNVE